MTSRVGLIILLVSLMLIELISLMLHAGSTGAPANRALWEIFLFAIPIVLVGFIVRKSRWAFMAAVMYGTIGLALDIATIVQESTKAESQQTVLLTSGLTGLFNFLLIAVGGRGFLDVLHPMSPPATHAPNLRFPSSGK